MAEDQETATENPVGEKQSGDDPISPCRDEARDSSEEGEILAKRTPRPRSRHNRNLIASSEGDNDDSEQDVAPIKRTPRPRNRRRYEHTASDEDGSDDVGIHSSTTKRRRLIHKGAPGAEETLEHGVERTPGPSCEVRGSQGRRSRRNKHLELLRRRRQGEGDSKADETSSSSGEDRVGLYDTDPENPALDEFDDEESDDQLRTGRSEENKDDDSRIDKAKNTDMDDFIDDSVGMNDASASLESVGFEIPLEFTAQARKPMSAYFQDAIEWLIQFHISPSFEKNRPTYLMAWRKLGDEVLALAVSRFSSSVWTAEFYRTLRARPYIDEHTPERYPTLAEDPDDCQACNRTNHPATSHIRFTGAPYDPDSLEELSNDSSSDGDGDGDGDSDEDDGDRDQHGHIIAAEGREWVVGSVCASNAQTAHDLYHWKHSLKDCVRDLLAQRGFLRQEKLAEREHLSVEECRELCVGINDDWVSTGVVERLYQEFTNMLEEARIKRTTRSRRAGRG